MKASLQVLVEAVMDWEQKLLVAMVVLFSFVLTAGCQQQSADSAQAATPLPLTSVSRNSATSDSVPVTKGRAFTAVDAAMQAQRYAFIFVWKTDDERTQSTRKTFQAFNESCRDRADAVEICVTSEPEASFVNKHDLGRAPLPLVLAFAPNGAIAGAFTQTFTKDDLAAGFISPVTANCMKFLQAGKLVALCIQNSQTQSNDAARVGVEEFRNDPRYATAVEVVDLDPSSSAESDFLRDLQVDPATSVAVTVLLVPPGSPVAKFDGATTKDAFVEAVTKASSGCCPGGQCGPGGCGPP